MATGPELFTIDLARRFFAIANETGCLPSPLDEMRPPAGRLHRQEHGAFIRQVITPGVWKRVVKLPLEMMAIARSQRPHAPNRAAVTARAVAITILSVAPVRLANLPRSGSGLT